MRLCSGNNHMTKEECLLFLHRIHLQNKGNLPVDQRVNRSAGDVGRDSGFNRGSEQQMNPTIPHINQQNFINAFKMVLNDIKVAPHVLVENLLKDCLHDKLDKDGDSINFTDLQKFFDDFETYFQQGDRLMFIEEIKTIKITKTQISIR